MAPRYISDLVRKKSSPQSALRSNDLTLLVMPRTNWTTLGDQVFAYAGPSIWYKLPKPIQMALNICSLKKTSWKHICSEKRIKVSDNFYYFYIFFNCNATFYILNFINIVKAVLSDHLGNIIFLKLFVLLVSSHDWKRFCSKWICAIIYLSETLLSGSSSCKVSHEGLSMPFAMTIRMNDKLMPPGPYQSQLLTIKRMKGLSELSPC